MNGRSAPGGKVRLVTIDDRHAGQRLDNYLFTLLNGVPKIWVYRVLRRGEVRVNKGRSKPDRRLQHGDVVRVPPVRQAEQRSQRPPDRLLRTIAPSPSWRRRNASALRRSRRFSTRSCLNATAKPRQIWRKGERTSSFLLLVFLLEDSAAL